MIRKYRFGNPFPTEAVVQEIPVTEGTLPYLEYYEREASYGQAADVDQSILVNLNEEELAERGYVEAQSGFRFSMGQDDVVYGLGGNVRGINKRGWTYTSYASDNPGYDETQSQLYHAHNFIVIDGEKRFGVYVDYPGELTFDVGYSDMNELLILPKEMNLDVYILEGDSKREIAKEFLQMIGRSFVAPRWAFGYGQSRWSYETADAVREVVKKHRENGLPLDMIYLDIDYMAGYRNFTINEEAFPNFEEFVKEMKEENIRLIPIIDAGVKAEEGYYVDDEGRANNYFVKDKDGNDFVAAVWPGEVHFPDFLNADAREWFGNSYQFLIEKGIEGFWNDMNEPAIFYSKWQADEVAEYIKKLVESGEITGQDVLSLGWKIGDLKNSHKDYQRMFHNVNGEIVNHDKVHNLYGYNMTRAAGEAFERIVPDNRVLMFSRSSHPGMHRYGGMWMGDNCSWWSHLKTNLSMLPGLNMHGFLYCGADLGGFGADVTEDLMLRWMALGIFTPLMRNHSAKGTRVQEAYRWTSLESFQRVLGLRYFLLPYIYSEYMKCCLSGDMLFRPLSFDYEEDTFASQVEDQLMMGDSIMIAPVLEQNAKGRYVYLPEEMKMVRLRSADDYDEEIMPAGHHYVFAELDEVLIFIRPDKAVAVATNKNAQCEAEVDFENVEFLSFVKTKAVYEYYHDDGISRTCELEGHIREVVIE